MKFSVVIPVYNAAASLRETLDSVAAQSFTDFEVVVVNDGSTDSSSEILMEWQKNYPLISLTVVEQENQGLGTARNRGIQAAGGEYIAFLDADDLWLPEKLQMTYQHLEQETPELCFHSVKSFGLGRKRARSGHSVKSLEDLLLKGNPLVPSAVVSKREIFLEFPFSTQAGHHGAEDLHLWIRLLAAGKCFSYLDRNLTLYRETGGMSTRLEEHLRHVKIVLEDALQHQLIDIKFYQEALRRKEYEAARFFHKRAAHAQARTHYQNARPLNAKERLLKWLNRLQVKL